MVSSFMCSLSIAVSLLAFVGGQEVASNSCTTVYFKNVDYSSFCLGAHLGDNAPATGINFGQYEQLPENFNFYLCMISQTDSSYNIKVKDYAGTEYCLYRNSDTSHARFKDCSDADVDLNSNDYIFYVRVPEKASNYIIQSASDFYCLSMKQNDSEKTVQFQSGCAENDPASKFQWKMKQ
eukprot:Pgem_evm1s19550